ncbi:MAG: riboflavin biosynthesis protein RibF [Kiritimatiellae bacterium]|nr:riboflavin biosynthesis protein RibF [Kiritimatiellia bacterium]
MKRIRQLAGFSKVPRPFFLAAGFFDGVHLGHQLIIRETVSRAREAGGESWVLTFDQHPLSVLAPDRAPALLYPLEDRLSQIESLGVDGTLILPFTRSLAAESPARFIDRLCGPLPQPLSKIWSEIRCGANWRFGSRASGTPELLATLGERYHFRAVIAPYAEFKGEAISSTRIRQAIQSGNLADATAMLGRCFSVRGTVCRGRGVGAKQLATATANLSTADLPVLPPCGVYATEAQLTDGRRFHAVTDLGVHPTFHDKSVAPLLETHLLDFQGDLYGQTIKLFFVARLRDEEVFPDAKALQRQILTDIDQARRIFATHILTCL